MGSIFDNVGLFLVQSVFDLYIFIVMLRVVLQWVNADFRNPLFQFVSKLTTLPLKPFRKILPMPHGIDLAAIVLLLLLEVIKLLILVWLQIAALPNFGGLVVLAFAELLGQLINIFFYAILAMAILSWVSPMAGGALAEVLYRLTEPLLRPLHRVIPLVAGIDITPIPALLILKLLEMIIVQPLIQIGLVLALGSEAPH